MNQGLHYYKETIALKGKLRNSGHELAILLPAHASSLKTNLRFSL